MTVSNIRFGDRVSVSAVYERARSYKSNGTWKKWWEPCRLGTPREALYIGYRTVVDGEADYIGEEEGTAFTPERHYRAALVVFSERERPVLVPLDALEVQP